MELIRSRTPFLFVLLLNLLLLFNFSGSSAAAANVKINLGLYLRLSTWEQDAVTKTNTRIKKGPAWESEAALALLAVEHFNRRDNSLIPAFETINNTCTIQLVPHVFDTQSHPQPTLNKYLQSRYTPSWQAYKPDIIVGASRSAVTTPLALLTSLHEVPHISFLSTSTKLDDSKTYATFLRTIPSDGLVAKTIAEAMTGAPFHAKRVSMIYVNDAYGTSYQEALQEACSANDILFDSYAFSYADTTSIEMAVSLMAAADARYIVAVVFDNDLESLMAKASEHGVSGKNHLWIFTDSIQSVSHVVQRAARDALDGSLRVYANGKSREIAGWRRLEKIWDGLGGLDGGATVQRFNQHLPPLNVTDPTFSFQLPTDMFQQRLGDRLQVGDVGDGGPFIVDAVATLGLAACEAQQAGHLQPLDKPSGKEMYTIAKKMSFDGVSGNVAFDPMTGSRSKDTSRIEMYNIRMENNEMNFIGYYNSGNWSGLDSGTIMFAGEASVPPPWRDAPTIDLHLIDPGVKILSYFLVSLNVLTAVGCALFTLKHWKSAVVKASQPLLLLLICVGCILSTFVIVPLSIDQTNAIGTHDASCRSIVPLFSFGFSVTFASLFAKQYRVLIVFQRAAKMKHGQKKDTTQMFALFVIGMAIAVNFIVVVVWDSMAPFQWVIVPIVVDSFNVVTSSVGLCHSSFFWEFMTTLAVYFFCLIIIGNIISWKTKALPSKYQESKWIAYSMISNFQMFAIGLPLMLLAGELVLFFVVVVIFMFLVSIYSFDISLSLSLSPSISLFPLPSSFFVKQMEVTPLPRLLRVRCLFF
jgi:hypothetical protein